MGSLLSLLFKGHNYNVIFEIKRYPIRNSFLLAWVLDRLLKGITL